jgi:hypothetical protein
MITRKKVVSDLWGMLQMSIDEAVLAEREACAKLAEQYGPNRPIVAVRPSERIRGQWEGEQAASGGISAAIRARGQA